MIPEKANEATQNRPQGARVLDAAFVAIDLEEHIDKIKLEETWLKSDRNAITVFKTLGMSVVLIALHEGAAIKEHEAEGLMSIQVIEGKIRFEIEGQSVVLKKKQLITLHKGITYSIKVKKESAVLMTLFNNHF